MLKEFNVHFNNDIPSNELIVVGCEYSYKDAIIKITTDETWNVFSLYLLFESNNGIKYKEPYDEINGNNIPNEIMGDRGMHYLSLYGVDPLDESHTRNSNTIRIVVEDSIYPGGNIPDYTPDEFQKIDAKLSGYVKEAKGYADSSKTNATESGNHSKTSESWAVGQTGTRVGEDIDNSKYYSEQSKTHSENSKSYLDEMKQKVANGELNGKDGESGVYVGSLPVPPGTKVHIDPNGSVTEAQDIPATVPPNLTAEPNVQSVLDALSNQSGGGGSGASGPKIDDITPSKNSVYSSEKVENLFEEKSNIVYSKPNKDLYIGKTRLSNSLYWNFKDGLPKDNGFVDESSPDSVNMQEDGLLISTGAVIKPQLPKSKKCVFNVEFIIKKFGGYYDHGLRFDISDGEKGVMIACYNGSLIDANGPNNNLTITNISTDVSYKIKIVFSESGAVVTLNGENPYNARYSSFSVKENGVYQTSGGTALITSISWDFDNGDIPEIKRINGAYVKDIVSRNTKLDKLQGVENSGKILSVNQEGIVTPSDMNNFIIANNVSATVPQGLTAEPNVQSVLEALNAKPGGGGGWRKIGLVEVANDGDSIAIDGFSATRVRFTAVVGSTAVNNGGMTIFLNNADYYAPDRIKMNLIQLVPHSGKFGSFSLEINLLQTEKGAMLFSTAFKLPNFHNGDFNPAITSAVSNSQSGGIFAPVLVDAKDIHVVGMQGTNVQLAKGCYMIVEVWE